MLIVCDVLLIFLFWSRRIAKALQLSLAVWSVICALVSLAEMKNCASKISLGQVVKDGPMVAVAAVAVVVGVVLCVALLLVKSTHHDAFIEKTPKEKLASAATKASILAAFAKKKVRAPPRRGSKVRVAPAAGAPYPKALASHGQRADARLPPANSDGSSSHDDSSADSPIPERPILRLLPAGKPPFPPRSPSSKSPQPRPPQGVRPGRLSSHAQQPDATSNFLLKLARRGSVGLSSPTAPLQQTVARNGPRYVPSQAPRHVPSQTK